MGLDVEEVFIYYEWNEQSGHMIYNLYIVAINEYVYIYIDIKYNTFSIVNSARRDWIYCHSIVKFSNRFNLNL